ncbi:MAG: hypothetical protein ACREPE_03075, partial [Lysobacter sp.]
MNDSASQPGSDDALRRVELTRILGQMTQAQREQAESALWGLALSGGGIRSATFALGALQALAGRGLLGAFHYVSTVSGGGYIGAYLQGMVHRHGLPATVAKLSASTRGRAGSDVASGRTAPGATSPAVLDLRRFSNFLSPNNAALSADKVSIVSTYLSNTLLTQVQLIALLLLLAFVPVLMYLAASPLSRQPLLAVGLAMLMTLLAMAARQRTPPGTPGTGTTAAGTGPAIETQRVPALIKGTPPVLLVLAFALVALQLWRSAALGPLFSFRVFDHTFRIGPQAMGVGAVYLTAFLAWLFAWWREARNEPALFTRRVVRQLVFGAVGVAAMTIAAQVMQRYVHLPGGEGHLWFVLSLGTPLLFLGFFVVSLMHIGLAFTSEDRVARERWARLMGQCALWVVFAIVLPTLLIVLGLWLARSDGEAGFKIPALSLASLAAVGSTVFGVTRAYQAQAQTGGRLATWLRNAAVAIAPWVFVTAVLVLAGFAAAWLIDRVIVRMAPSDAPFALYLATLHDRLSFLGSPRLAWVLVAVAAVWLLFAYFIDENEFSMNGFYRNRLVRCYLGPSNPHRRGDPETDLDPVGDDLKLAELLQPSKEEGAHGRPLYPLLCGAVNLVATDQLDWQDRKAASFVFSPLFCGHQPLHRPDARAIGDRPRGEYEWHDDLTIAGLPPSVLAQAITLGTAMSVSGAAISPNMGYHSSPAVTFLLTLFNARLGWWVENYNAPKGAVDFIGSNLLSELLSRTTDRGRYAHVSDGGHFENLGLYELVRRRCRFILSIDASADPDRDFASLGNAIHKCRVDFGAEIDIDVAMMRPDAKTRISKRCAALGKITYNDGTTGVLLYFKPALLGNEPPDIGHYGSAHPEFPHEPTSDQCFDEQQFESYRHLGLVSCQRVLGTAVERVIANPGGPAQARRSLRDGSCNFGLGHDPRKELLLQELTYGLYEPSNAVSLHFTRHGEALTRLFDTLRTSKALSSLDEQLNPAWRRVSGAGRICTPVPPEPPRHLMLPQQDDFRACFYFVQELIQLMEAVYIDLDLERNWHHPDNRGWMNLFRHWVWVPMFRGAWSRSAQTRGS